MNTKTAVKEITNLLTQQLNKIIHEPFPDFPTVVVFATKNTDQPSTYVFYVGVEEEKTDFDSEELEGVLQWSQEWVAQSLS